MKNPYGILNSENSIAYVDDVARGLACNCVCPLCHKSFRACQGEKNQHYFAHQDASECEFSYRASLLRMVVDYLQSGKMEIPDVVARYMSEEEILSVGETVVFDRVEQLGDMKNPELHCFLGARSWVLRPLFEKKSGAGGSDKHLVLDLTKFLNPYESRPDRNLVPLLRSKSLLKWENYPGVEERKQVLRERHQKQQAAKRESTAHRFRVTEPHKRSAHRHVVRPRPTPKPVFSFKEEPLPCKFCKKIIQPTDAMMTKRSEGFCVCRTCNRKRGGDIHT